MSGKFTKEQIKAAAARAKAKAFITHLCAENWAEPIPEEWESMTDEQIGIAIQYLKDSGRVRQREDRKWERAY